MMNLRAISGLGALVLAVASGVAGGPDSVKHGPTTQDPANLAGERVRPSEVVRNIAANEGATALWQSLLKLQTRASLMLIVAHPDDEDGGMLTYEVRGKGAHAAMLTLTRGEGGQNLMSGDFNDALGLVRTQELLAAGRYMGVDQMWGTEVDFGFSKTKEEAFANWGHDRALYDAVRAVRLYRPLVMMGVFVGSITDGHGQHQVSGEMAQEVFDAAGDPNVFPEMGLEPWSPLKVYARIPFYSLSAKGMFDYATGKYAPAQFYNYVTKERTTEAPKTNVVVPEGEYSSVLGMTYLQFARLGLGLQKSQNGGGGVPMAGAFDMPYHRYGSRVKTVDDEKSFFDGVDTTLPGIASLAKTSPASETAFLRDGLAKIDELVQKAVHAYAIDSPEKSAPFLREGLRANDELIAKVQASGLTAHEKYDIEHELAVKRVQFNDALVQALGLSLRAQVVSTQAATGPFARFQDGADTFTTAIPGQSFSVQLHLANGSGVPVKVVAEPDGVMLEGECHVVAEAPAKPAEPLANGAAYDQKFAVTLDEKQNPTRPPFSRPGIEQAYYDVADPAMRNASLPLPPLTAWATVDYLGVPIKLGQVVQTTHRVTGLGLVYEPLVIAPAISVAVTPAAGVVPLDQKSLMVTAKVRSNVKGEAKGTVRLELPTGWTSKPERAEFVLTKDGDAIDLPFVVTPAKLAETAYTMTAVAEYNGKEYREGYHTVGYPGLLPANLYRPATYRARGVDVKIAPGLKVAYLPGTGDEVEASLENLGIHATTLTMSDVAAGRLWGYDAVVLGVRAYAAHPELAAANGQLLSYAKAGGVVIVQYNTAQFDHNFGPYPLTLGGNGDLVVDEHAAVKVLTPQDPLLNWPNKITEHDFDGWVEERGHGFMRSWDPQYSALLETHDTDQDPQKGGLLYAQTGKGVYVYVAFALYRELPEGVPGAYRLFANLVSLGKNPGMR
jgi:LmbE family N-acetylglucosaminyl deacetylase